MLIYNWFWRGRRITCRSLPSHIFCFLWIFLKWICMKVRSELCADSSESRVKGVALTVREVSGAEGLVRDTISWIASLSLSLCSGLLMPISLWISVSDSADMMAPLFTLARQAATYHAGMPTHSCGMGERNIFVNAIIVVVVIIITEHWSVFSIFGILLCVIALIIIITMMAAWCEYMCMWHALPQAKRPPLGHPTEQTEGLSSVHLPKARAW